MGVKHSPSQRFQRINLRQCGDQQRLTGKSSCLQPSRQRRFALGIRTPRQVCSGVGTTGRGLKLRRNAAALGNRLRYPAGINPYPYQNFPFA